MISLFLMDRIFNKEYLISPFVRIVYCMEKKLRQA